MEEGSVRRLALALPHAYEDTHRGHPSFRINRRIFAMLRPEPRQLIVKLEPEDQHNLLEGYPAVVTPAAHYSHHGWTRIGLETTDEALVALSLRLAWLHVAPRRMRDSLR